MRGRSTSSGPRSGSDASPTAPVVVIDGAGHGAHASHPDGFADLVRLALVPLGPAREAAGTYART